MGIVLVSKEGQILLPVAVRKALGLTPGMRVEVRVEGKCARITPTPAGHTVKLAEIQSILKYSGPKLLVKDMRVTESKD